MAEVNHVPYLEVSPSFTMEDLICAENNLEN